MPRRFRSRITRGPAIGRLAEAVLHGDQLLGTVRTCPDHDQRAEPVLLQANVEVNAVDPDVDVVAIPEIAALEAPVFLLPDREQVRDVGRAEPGRILAEQRLQRRPEVSAREPAQIQDRQHLGHLRRTPHVRRQDRTREPLPLSFGIRPPIVDPPRRDLERSRTDRHPARAPSRCEPQSTTLPIALPSETLQIGIDLDLQYRREHPPSAFPCKVVQAQRELVRLPLRSSLTTFSIGGVSFPPVAKPGVCVNWSSRGRIRRLFHPLNSRSTTFEYASVSSSSNLKRPQT
jgi:hypothetical protein